MAKHVLTNAGIWFGGYDLTGDLNACELQTNVDAVEQTTFGAAAHNFRPGLLATAFSAAGYWEAENTDAVVAANLGGSVDDVLIAAPVKAAGEVAYMLKALLSEYRHSGQVGQMHAFDLGVGARDRHVRGVIAALETADANDAAAGVQLGALSASQRLWAAAMTTAAPGGTTPTLDLKVQSDDADTFASATDRITFAQLGARGQQMLSVDGAVTDDWWRFSWTVGGTAPSWPIVAAFGIVDI